MSDWFGNEVVILLHFKPKMLEFTIHVLQYIQKHIFMLSILRLKMKSCIYTLFL